MNDPWQPAFDSNHEAMAVALEATGDYRVLRRLTPLQQIEPHDGSPTRLGIFLDVETTGLDAQRDEIIELAMVPFSYRLDGRVFEVGKAFSHLRQPSVSVPPEITRITGIDDAMVAGKVIDPQEVASFVAPAAIVIAHNAAFDRRFLERFCEVFTTKPWACSMSQVDWVAAGHEGTKLSYLCASSGFFHDAHRALDDCHAAIQLLAQVHPRTLHRPLAELLERARKPTWRIWAEHSPYDLKDQLKARGYHWNGEGTGSPKAWYIDVEDGAKEAELSYLAREIYQREIELLMKRVDAHDRFSNRC